ncbi:hypothetical protein HJFPF1_06900 [Paramyrothecium foliicola]|nr:hypothetical protein HJFPF1_06900 [Paramyrothecium foliicola]
MSFSRDVQRFPIGLRRDWRRQSPSSSDSSASPSSSSSEDDEDLAFSPVFNGYAAEDAAPSGAIMQMAPFPMEGLGDSEGSLSQLQTGQPDEQSDTEEVSAYGEDAEDWEVVDMLDNNRRGQRAAGGSSLADTGLYFDEERDEVHVTEDLQWDRAHLEYDPLFGELRHESYAFEGRPGSWQPYHEAVLRVLIANAHLRRPNLDLSEHIDRLFDQAAAAGRGLVDRATLARRLGQEALRRWPQRPMLPANLPRELAARVQETLPRVYNTLGGSISDIAGAFFRDGALRRHPEERNAAGAEDDAEDTDDAESVATRLGLRRL